MLLLAHSPPRRQPAISFNLANELDTLLQACGDKYNKFTLVYVGTAFLFSLIRSCWRFADVFVWAGRV